MIRKYARGPKKPLPNWTAPIKRQLPAMKQTKTPTYFSYLLRLWRNDEFAPWRAALKSPLTGKQHAFAGLKELVRFLEEQTGEPIDKEKTRQA